MAANLHLIKLLDCLVDPHDGVLPEEEGKVLIPSCSSIRQIQAVLALVPVSSFPMELRTGYGAEGDQTCRAIPRLALFLCLMSHESTSAQSMWIGLGWDQVNFVWCPVLNL